MLENMDANRISKACLSTWITNKNEIDDYSSKAFWPNSSGMPLKHVIEACHKYPDRFIPFFAPDPRLPGALKKLESAICNHGVRGFGELKVRMVLDDPRLLEILHFCGEAGLPAIIHMDIPIPPGKLDKNPGYWYCCGWENLERLLELCPKTIICGHAPGFWREISGDADTDPMQYPSGPVMADGRLWNLMDSRPNLYCDLSANSGYTAISRDRALGIKFLSKYADRCLFGRDDFDSRLSDYLAGLGLPQEILSKIMGTNALRILKLN